MLLFSPRWLFLYPGLALFAVGIVLSAGAPPGTRLRVGGLRLDIHTLLVAGFLALLGYQLVLFAVFTKIFAIRAGFHPPYPPLESAVPLRDARGRPRGGRADGRWSVWSR